MELGTAAPDKMGHRVFTGDEKSCSVYRFPQLPYQAAVELQNDLVRRRKAGELRDTLVRLERSPVITMGRNSKREHLLSSAAVLEKQGIECFETNRGGDMTFHGPGQLLAYPILDLSRIRKDVVWYVRTLEEVLIRTAGDFGLQGERREGLTGVWIAGAKVAAIGIHISRWVTSHGFALNLETDLSYFEHIVPCGIAGCRVTSFRELLGARVDRALVEERIVRHLGELLGTRMWLCQPGGLEQPGKLERSEQCRSMC